jgi:hypothetical protein
MVTGAVEEAVEEIDPGVEHGGAEEEDEDFDADELWSLVHGTKKNEERMWAYRC